MPVKFHSTTQSGRNLHIVLLICTAMPPVLMYLKGQIYLFFLIICCSACQQPGAVDVSHIPVEIQVERFDRALAELNHLNMDSMNNTWGIRYGQFYDDYMQYILSAGSTKDTSELYANLSDIISSPDFDELGKEVAATFPHLDEQQEGLTDAFKRIKYYFPEAKIPRFISFFSGFSVQCPINEEYIGIGLDMFLGADSKFYPALISSIPRYVSKRFTPENIVPRCTEVYLREELMPDTTEMKSLLDHMVYNGKILYLMDMVLPKTPDSLKIGYHDAQMEWAVRYQREIWMWMLEEELLYSTDYNYYQRFLGDAPFTPELGTQRESAPKLGMYIGWQIVRKYMEKNPDATLSELMALPAQSILNKASFKG